MTMNDFVHRVANDYNTLAGRNVLDSATGQWVNEVEYCGLVMDDYRLVVGLAILEQADKEQV